MLLTLFALFFIVLTYESLETILCSKTNKPYFFVINLIISITKETLLIKTKIYKTKLIPTTDKTIDNNNNSKLPEIKKKKNIYFNKETDSQLLYLKSDVKRYFNDKNMKRFKEEYNNPYYKKMVNDAIEEIERSSLTDFKLIFPLKENLEIYSKFLIRDGADDTNIVFWQYILTN